MMTPSVLQQGVDHSELLKVDFNNRNGKIVWQTARYTYLLAYPKQVAPLLKVKRWFSNSAPSEMIHVRCYAV